ncbi:MAG: amino acid adenylation domain-containing protein [Nitrospinae bacterium]|nr:amino acid adenylation domain-containing protein [Nitrospinota bacterium]
MKFSSITEVLSWRASRNGDKTAFTFLHEGKTPERSITFRQLDEQACALATTLKDLGAEGERALLIYPAGIEFVVAFMGCLYAGVIAVPLPPPDSARLKRSLPRLNLVAEDSGAKFVLCLGNMAQTLESSLVDYKWLKSMRLIATDGLGMAGQTGFKGAAAPEGIAYLQYTSGSTSDPKGVIVRHENIMANSMCVQRMWSYSEESVSLVWMPNFHDYGLVDGIIQPIFSGASSYLMSPMAFLKNPLRWVEAVSRFGVTNSGGPNFAFEYCAAKITPEKKAGLDLSRWKVAHCGAEPIRKVTVDSFTKEFSICGFDSRSFYAGYGLAEATLMVTTKRRGSEPPFFTASAASLEKDLAVPADGGQKARHIAGCGVPAGDMDVVIADPDSHARLEPGKIGEVWVAGQPVSPGYWGKEKESGDTFRAQLAGESAAKYLRTGDLGFMLDGELYITGRRKDLVIIGGVNHYPQDIELTVESCHPNLRKNGSAAFSVDVEGEERLCVVAEVDSAAKEFGAILRQIISAVSENHELEVFAAVLIRKGTLLKTTSGKVQRGACRKVFLEGGLEEAAVMRKKAIGHASHPAGGGTGAAGKIMAKEQAVNSISVLLAQRLGLRLEEIVPAETFSSFGLSSREAVRLAGELEEAFGMELAPTILWKYPTVDSLAGHLCGEADLAQPSSLERRNKNSSSEPIAIVGIGLKFPGADDPDSFWRMLLEGKDAISEVPAGRWPIEDYYDPAPATPGKMNTRWGGFIDGVDMFDAEFFGITPREAEAMDPQQRLVLETAWRALENAGIPPAGLAGSAGGVFIGVSADDYSRLQFNQSASSSAYAGTGSSLSLTANRLSYYLDLKGPSLAVDTACSSSLMAVHLAVGALRRGECDLALAGGVSLTLTPHATVALSQAKMLSPTGRCRTFGADADGYARGEGCGVVVMKSLSDALESGDRIIAIVRGSAVNQDGRSNGLTAPNGLSQVEVMRRALSDAGVEPRSVGYVEAHGTGTPLGDPIEMESIKTAFGGADGDEAPCHTSSVKTNIGHLEAAAGVAGLIKTALSLWHGKIPPHANLKKINPLIKLEGTRFAIPEKVETFHSHNGVRRAGVSSFGFGGANAHVILESHDQPIDAPSTPERPLHVIAISAKNGAVLMELAAKYLNLLESDPAIRLADLACAANAGRSHMPVRAAFVAGSCAELAEKLRVFIREGAPAKKSAGVKTGDTSRLPAHDEDMFASREKLEQLAAAYRDGVNVDWTKYYSRRRCTAFGAPLYPFQRKRHWALTEHHGTQPGRAATELPGEKIELADPPGGCVYQGAISAAATPWIAGHIINGEMALPGVAYMLMALDAAFGEGESVAGVEMNDIRFDNLIIVRGAGQKDIFTQCTPDGDGHSIAIYSAPDINHMKCGIRKYPRSGQSRGLLPVDEIKARLGEPSTGARFYEAWVGRGFSWSEGFNNVTDLWTGEGEALALVETPSGSGLGVRAGILDACGHSLAEIAGGMNKGVFVFKSADSFRMHLPIAGKKFWSHATGNYSAVENALTGDITIALETGEVAAEFRGVRLVFINAMAEAAAVPAAKEADPINDDLLQTYGADMEKAIRAWLASEAGRIFMIKEDEIDIDTPLGALGMDSLMAMDLADSISARLKIKISAVELMGDDVSLAGLAKHLAGPLPDTANEAAGLIIPEAPTAENFSPLSYGQRALWFVSKMSPDSAAYNVAFAAAIRSQIGHGALRAALDTLAQRHPALRTVFTMAGGEVKCRELEEGRIEFNVTQALGSDDAAVREQVNKAYGRPFDLENGPLARVDIFTRSPKDHVMLVTVSHIICDGWSLWLLMDEMGKLYGAQVKGTTADLPPVAKTYGDFTSWQKGMVDGPEGRKSLEYWTKRISGDIPPLDLPVDRPRPEVKTENGATVNFDMPGNVSEGIKRLAREANTTPYTVALSAFFAFLYRYTNQETLLAGSPMAARPSSGFYGVAGDFVNPVVMRADIKKGQTFRSLLDQTRAVVMEAMERQDYPFGLLVEKLKVRRDPARSPLFDVMFIYQKPQQSAGIIGMMAVAGNGASFEWGGLAMAPFGVAQQEGQMDLALEIAETPDAMFGSMKYNTDIYGSQTVSRMASHYMRMLEAAINSPDTPIAAAPMMRDEELRGEIDTWNATDIRFDMPRPVHEIFEEAARRAPQSPAVISETGRITYGELDAASDRIALRLVEEGCVPGGLAAVFMERSPEALAGIIGAMKAGLAYVPVDPEYPAQRVEFMLGDACPAAVIANSRTASRLAPGKWKIIPADSPLNGAKGPAKAKTEAKVAMDCLAYVIYTSGSTGTPKGVMVTHANLFNSTMARMAYYAKAPERYLLLSSLSFDSSVAGLFWTLCSGGAIVLPPKDFGKDIGSLADLIAREKVTHTLALPSLYSLLLGGPDASKLESLKVVIAAGEVIPPSLPVRHHDLAPGADFYNEYGPTEGTVWCCAHKCEADNGASAVPIGRPIANAKLYVLNEAMEPAPAGVAGELYIGGPQVAKGYLNQPELTEERFVADPFSRGGRLYRTGDIARRLKDGALEFIGRMDGQVKVRGYRIEQGEIEAALLAHPSVKEAAVTAWSDPSGGKRIVAYITSANGALDVLRIKEYLGGKLPSFMVPSAIVTLDAMPLSPNGKLDKKALPAPDMDTLRGENEYTPPSNEMETLIASVWGGLLNMEKVGARDNFFDMGGHSLLMARAHAALQEKMARNFSIVEMYKNPTIESLAAALAGNGDDGAPSAKLAEAAARGGLRGEMSRMRAARRGMKK